MIDDELQRWQAIERSIAEQGPMVVQLASGLRFEVHGDNPIERALLLSVETEPSHVWEPQTTRLLLELAPGSRNVVVGGAFIGDQALPIAQRIAGDGGVVHAFEPMKVAYSRLVRNIQLNGLMNVRAHRAGLWNVEGPELVLDGELALASAQLADDRQRAGDRVPTTTIDALMLNHHIDRVGLIALDIEGGELRALAGASELLASVSSDAPNLVFEIHRAHVDWSDGLGSTEPVALVRGFGYEVYAIRDYQANVAMQERPIEIVPIKTAHLDGPPHGFNLFATKTPDLIERLDLRVVPDVSPKLLLHGDPAIHAPLA